MKMNLNDIEGGGYVFDASAQTLTISPSLTFELHSFLAVINVTRGILMYSCVNADLGATYNNLTNVLTLVHDTTSYSDDDDLIIIVDKKIVQTATNPSYVSQVPLVGTGWDYSTNASLMATAHTEKGSAATLGGYHIYNPNSTATYVQVFDNAGGIIPGSTQPAMILGVPAASTINCEYSNGIKFSNAIKTSATISPTGPTAPSTGLVVSILYK